MSFPVIFKFDHEMTLNDIQNDFKCDLESDLDMTLGDLDNDLELG